MRRLIVAISTTLLAAVGLWRFVPPSDAPPAADPPGPPWFADVTDAAGIDFVHDAGPADGRYFMPQIIGSGAAVLDFDGDGKPDLLLLSNGGPASKVTNKLYRNLGSGKFADVSRGSGLDFAGHCMGAAVGDVNNDGRPDVLITLYGGVRLFLNQGTGRFEDVTEAAGLRNPGWGTSAAFLDFDRDGRLDLVVVNYVDYDPSWPCRMPNGDREYCSPRVFPGTVTRLFHNQGASTDGAPVHFRDVSIESGIGRVPGPGLGVLCADFDGDGWPDIFVANDAQPNRLWINQQDGTFKEEAGLRGIAYSGLGLAQAGMGVTCGDVDGDGLSDVFVTHLRGETHTLWAQQPRGLFRDRTGGAGLARPRWQGTGFGTALIDLDHDGALDLAVVNGGVSRQDAPADVDLKPHWRWYAERNQLFANDGAGRFRDLSPEQIAFCGRPNVARGLAWADFDGDGRIDLVVTAIDDRARIYRNVTAGGHWLIVRPRLPSPASPEDARCDRDAIGAEITVEAGDRRWQRVIHAGDSYLCCSDTCAHFGLGSADRVSAIAIRWPDGSRERFAGTAADRAVALRKGQGEAAEAR